MTEFITEIIQETTKSINCKGKFVSWYWKNSKVLINLYVNFQKNILICLHDHFYNDWAYWAKCKTFSSDEIKNHLQLIVLIEGTDNGGTGGNCSQRSECYDEASSSTCDNDTLSCVNILSVSTFYKLHVITQHQGSYQVMEGAE